MVYQLDSLS